MNKRQKIVQQQFLNNEEAVIRSLKKTYNQSYNDVTKKVLDLDDNISYLHNVLNGINDDGELTGSAKDYFRGKTVDPNEARTQVKSLLQSKVYQKNYQTALQGQLDTILDKMVDKEYKTVSAYLKDCYDDGFIGALYDIQGQGIPLAFPIDQEAVTRAVQLDSKISQGLYTKLGEDVNELKKHITAQVSRGMVNGDSFQKIGQQIGFQMMGTYDTPGGAYAKALRIARTEGHRIQCQSGMDACYKAKEKGADVVKQWDSTLDGKTRSSHISVDGEARELDEAFSNKLMFPGDPSGGASEVVNCRCALLQRARWGLNSSSTKMNNFTKEIETFDSPEDYSTFKKAFFSKENKDYMNFVEQMEGKYKTKDFAKVLGAMGDREYTYYSNLLKSNPLFNKKSEENLTKIDKSATMQVQKATFDSMKLTGIDADYLPEVEETFNGLMNDYPVQGLSVKTNKASGEFGHFNGQVKGTKKNGQSCAVWNNEICISRTSYKDKATSIDDHNYTYKVRHSPLANAKNVDLATIPHEYGHAIDTAYVLAKDKNLMNFVESFKTPQKIGLSDVNIINDFNRKIHKSDKRLSKEIFDELQKEYNLDYMGTIMRIDKEYGSYASSSISEFLAEAFSTMRILPDKDKTDFMKSFEKIFNRKYKETFGGG